jgi:subtilisin
MSPESPWRRRALVFGLPIAVVAAAVAVVAVLTVGDDGDEREAALRPEARMISPPRAPSSLPKPKFPAEPAGRAEPEPEPKPIPLPDPTSDERWDELIETAQDEGSVPVIVTLRPRIRPEGALEPEQRAAQQERIETVGDRVLEEVAGDVEEVERFNAVPLVALEASPEALQDLRESRDVVSVVEDVPVPLTLPRRPPRGSAQAARTWSSADHWWHLSRSETSTAWNNGYDGRGQTVAILDTGVQSNHPWLTGKVVSEACFSAGGNCPGGGTVKYGAGSGRPCTFLGICGHGTHVAHDAAGTYGVARSARIIAIQVFSRVTQNCPRGAAVCASAYTSDQVKGLERVYQLRNTHRIAAVNVSIGGGKYPSYCDNSRDWYTYWLRTLQSYGIATVIATGNDGFTDGVNSPGCHASAIAAGGTALDSAGSDAMYYYSNSSPQIFNVLAPGEFICSAWPTSSSSCGNGTSYATPQITGAFATLRQLNPQASIASIRDTIVCTGAGMRDRSGVVRARLRVWSAVVRLYNGGC